MGDLDGITILVAEDDDGILSLLKTFFKAQGATIYAEENGKNVVAHVEQFCPDIILLDVVMPYADGLSLLSELRQKGNTTPIIMLTDKSTVNDKVEGLDRGADDYMAKPFSPKELLSRVKSLLRRAERGEEKQAQLGFGNLQINLASREVLVGESEYLRLTKTEFDLLHYLVARKAVVASHADLLNNVLGYKNPIETKALVMHVANIRKKMAKVGVFGGRIETIAGVGYMLKEE